MMTDFREAVQHALDAYAERAETAFSDWHKIRNGERLALDIKEALDNDSADKAICIKDKTSI